MATDMIDVASLGVEPGSSPTESASEIDAGTVSSVESLGGNQDSQHVSRATSGDTPAEVTGKAVRDAIRRLSASSPDDAKLLKQLAETHFREAQGWKGAFETPQKALEIKNLVEAAGGPEAIAAGQQRLQAYDQQETGLEAGDPAVLDSFFADYPQGAATLAPHYLARLEKSNPQALAAAVGPYAVDMMTQAGFGTHLKELLTETDPERVKAGLERLNDWFGEQRQNAQQARQAGPLAANPQADKIKQERQQLDKEREDIFRTGVTERVNATVAQPITALVEQYAKQYKLNDTQKATYKKLLEQSVIEEMNADQNYLRQADLRNANKARTTESVANFVAGEFSRRAKDKALEVARSIFGVARGTVQPAGTGVVNPSTPLASPSGGPLLISGRPPDSLLNMNRPNADLELIKGRGWLKDGRYVTWRRPTA